MKQRFVELHEEYGIDRREFGKVLFIASVSILVMAIHATMTIQSTAQAVEKSNNQMDQASAVLNSQNFRNAMDTLKQIRSNSISNQLNIALDSLDKVRESMDQNKEVEKKLQNTTKTYQWISLISIVGIVTGIAVIYS